MGRVGGEGTLTAARLLLQVLASLDSSDSSDSEEVTEWEGLVRISLMRMLAEEVRAALHPEGVSTSLHACTG